MDSLLNWPVLKNKDSIDAIERLQDTLELFKLQITHYCQFQTEVL